ncbi:MAG TPA: BatD family protein [Agriterribacter sp.]|nr:BatD family protein [Agriterribacter sp.]
MKRIGKYLLQIAFLLFLFHLSFQQGYGQVKAIASADKDIVQQDELIRIQFNIENAGQVQQFIPPDFKGCRVVAGPMHVAGSSAINGIVTNYVSFVYTLQPQEAGNYSLSGASAKIDHRRFVFNTIRFKVGQTKAGTNQYNFQSQQSNHIFPTNLYSDYILREGEDIHSKIRENLFIKVDVSKKSCFEGEPVVATYKLYTRLHSESKVARRPSFNGFSVYDMADPSAMPSTIETLNGKDFNVYLIRKSQLFPLQSGVLELDCAEVENSITFLRADEALKDRGEHLPELLRSFEMDNVSNKAVVTEHVNIKCIPLRVEVKALPLAAKPVSFDGAVGKFSIEATIDKNEIALNDAATVKVIIKGEGNLGIINAPDIHWPHDIEVYTPTVKEDFLKSAVPMCGYKTFTYTVMPKHVGKITIAPFEFSYFNPESNHYQVEKTDSIVIHALPVVQKNSMALGIATDYDYPPSSVSRLWVMIVAVVLLLLFGFLLYRFIRSSGNGPVLTANEERDQKKATVQNAQTEIQPAFLSNPFFNARLMLIQQNDKSFYAELDKALLNFMKEKLQIPDHYSNINKKDIVLELKAKGFDDIIISQFQLLNQQCEIALYTPVNNESEMQCAYDLAEDLVDNIDKILRDKPATWR